jgi:hypothetical protein
LEGTYSADFSGAGWIIMNKSIASTNPIYGFFKIKVTTAGAASENTVFTLEDAATNDLCRVRIGSDTGSDFDFGVTAVGGNADFSASAYSLDTTYNVWVDFTKGSSNATCNLYVSTDGTKGSVVATSNDGTGNTDTAIIEFNTYGIASQEQYLLDHVRAGATASDFSGVPQ